MESALPARTPLNIKVLSLLLLATIVGCGEPKSVIETSDGSTMILIPAGTFPRGGTEEEVSEAPDRHILTYIAERPVSDITLTAFYLDKLEVTHAQYADFLQSAGTRDQWDHENQPDNIDHNQRHITDDMREANKPATGLNWFDAYAYCSWADKRLPSEAEWEYAARGTEYQIYPWGDHPVQHDGIFFANYRPKATAGADGHKTTAPVGSFPDGVSPFGILDMAGNAEEWVQDWYGLRYFAASLNATNPPGPVSGEYRVIKGGSYGTADYEVRIAQRFKGKPHNKGPRLGFRCARDI